MDLPRQALAPLGTAFSALSAKLSAAAKEVGKHFRAFFFPKASLRCLGSRLGVFREERGLSSP